MNIFAVQFKCISGIQFLLGFASCNQLLLVMFSCWSTRSNSNGQTEKRAGDGAYGAGGPMIMMTEACLFLSRYML